MAACTLLLVQLTGCTLQDAWFTIERVRPIAFVDWAMWDALGRLARQVEPLALGYRLPRVLTLADWRQRCTQFLDQAHGCNGQFS